MGRGGTGGCCFLGEAFGKDILKTPGTRKHLRCTLPETNSLPLKMDGWKLNFLLGRTIFRGYVSFREGIYC